MRAAALDFGKARIGLAVADELGLLAHPRPPLAAGSRKAALAALAALASAEKIERFVVGLPVTLSGEQGAAARRVRTFAQQVADATGCDVELWDERLTTVQAKRVLRDQGVSSRDERGVIDGVAACLILQAWLDARSNER